MAMKLGRASAASTLEQLRLRLQPDKPGNPQGRLPGRAETPWRWGKGTIMKNVELTVEGIMLTIKVDLSKEFGPSASGKTIIIASTEGNVTI